MNLQQTLIPAQADDVLELDEIWSFVEHKQNQRWTWIAMCRRTRQIVAFVIGDRSTHTCKKLYRRIPTAYRKCRSFSDFWASYNEVFSKRTHTCVDKSSGETNHIERFNNTLRQRLARYTRKTLSFSKSHLFHFITTKLFINLYNLSLHS